MATTVIKHSHVPPSSGAPVEQILPLLHFDINSFRFPPTQNIFCYEFECSKLYFLETIVPKLKNSLSLALKHFPPLSGKMVFPLTSNMPVSHYAAGDSISFIVAESSVDLSDFVGFNPLNEELFFEFVPNELSPLEHLADSIQFPVFAVQATLFPNQGISIGFTVHHTICDFFGIMGFLHAWALIARCDGDKLLLASPEKYLPFYARSLSGADKLATAYWNIIKKYCRPRIFPTATLLTGNVQRTFSLSDVQLKKLKHLASDYKKKKVATKDVSSFVATISYVWTCLAKSESQVADEEPEYLFVLINCRPHLNLPNTYFGNCLERAIVESTHGRLKEIDAFAATAEATQEAIRKAVDNINGERIIDSSERDLMRSMTINGNNRVVVVAGSPQFDIGGIDFGWGKPKQMKFVHRSGVQTVCITKLENQVEISLLTKRSTMDAFAAAFNSSLGETSRL